jgi:TusE/DsrC/DsvC family sulfur relay protein
MASEMNEVLNPHSVTRDPDFKHAPPDWAREQAVETAKSEGLELTEEHWEVIRALQEFYDRHYDKPIRLRELHDALEERFHNRGGRKHLFDLLPGGPVAQGCRLAGLKAPSGSEQPAFGSVS